MRGLVLALTFAACSFDSGGSLAGAGSGGLGGSGGIGGSSGSGGSGGSAGTGGTGGNAGTGGSAGMPIDAAVIVDAAMPDSPPPPDAAIDAPVDPCSSGNGQHICLTMTSAGYCNGDQQPVLDHTCPTGSLCSSGHCQPPAGAQPCVNRTNCGINESCDLYVTSNGVKGYCTTPVGVGGPFSACSSDSDCRTGVCATGTDGSRNCLEVCAMSCPPGMCLDVTSTLEGDSLTGIKSCFQ
jgi:hypothetical protein